MNYSQFYYDNDWHGYLAPLYCNDETALEFDEFLYLFVKFPLDDFGSNYPWESPVPPREEWSDAVAQINRSMEGI